MVADGALSFLTSRLMSRRGAEAERRWAVSVWLLIAMATLAWLGVIAALLLVVQAVV